MRIVNFLAAVIILCSVPAYILMVNYADTLNAAFLPLRSSSLLVNCVTGFVFGTGVGQGIYTSIVAIQFFLLSIATYNEIFSLLW